MVKINGGITTPVGFKQAAVHSGIKNGRRLDLALIISEAKAVAAAVFTSNSIKAAPVIMSKRYINMPHHRGVILNSGNANCLTGRQGLSDALLITRQISSLVGCKTTEILICSTGIIGKRLPVDKIKNALPNLICRLSEKDTAVTAQAIMTTDRFRKELAYSFKVGTKTVKIAGIAKGAGMIAPNLATMLCIITTDAKIKKSLLKKALKEAVDSSFNIITIDGAMSTNDTVLVFANGMSGVDVAGSKQIYNNFVSTLKQLCLELAKMIVRDGEGATKFIEIEVRNAKSKKQARDVALSIANSPLFKTMCYGEDPNFGRIACACGASLADINPDMLDIYLNDKLTVRGGVAVNKDLPQNLFKKSDINIMVNLNIGKAMTRIFTSDLTPEYVRINAAYS